MIVSCFMFLVSMAAPFLWASPISVETQNFASVHEESRPFLESRNGTIVLFKKFN